MLVILYLLSICLITWYIRSQHIFDKLFYNDILKQLRNCWYCLSFWVALLLYFVFGVNLLQFLESNMLIVLISPVFTALIMSLLSYYVQRGFKAEHIIEYVKLS